MNYFLLLTEKCEQLDRKIFLQVDGRAISYKELHTAAAGLALAMKGLTRQSVLIDMADAFDQLVGFLAVQAAGCVPVLLHQDLPAGEVQALRNTNGICALLTAADERLDAGAKQIRQGRFALQLFAGNVGTLPPESEVCMGVLSSGSSGIPKVMLRSFASWADFFPVQNEMFRVGEATRLFLQGSLSFTGNLNSLLAVLFAGGTVVTSRHFRCRTWIALLETFAVDVIYLVPVKLKLLLTFLHRPLPSVRMIFTGSQLLGAATARSLRAVFPASEILLYYGASELNYITCITYEEMLQNPQSVGRPFPGVRLSIRGGCVYVDTPYHVYGAKRPFSVGDQGYLDEGGQLIFLGRGQRIVNRGGVKVSCLKVELAIREIPGVQDAVVLPYADELRGSEIAAFIVAAIPEDKSVVPALRQCLPPAEQPRQVVFLPALPINDRGKADTKKLQAML